MTCREIQQLKNNQRRPVKHERRWFGARLQVAKVGASGKALFKILPLTEMFSSLSGTNYT
jgi:hypothetical protein